MARAWPIVFLLSACTRAPTPAIDDARATPAKPPVAIAVPVDALGGDALPVITLCPAPKTCRSIAQLAGHPDAVVARTFARRHLRPIELAVVELPPGTPDTGAIATHVVDGVRRTGLMTTQFACTQAEMRFGIDRNRTIYALVPPARIDPVAKTCTTRSGVVPCDLDGNAVRMYVLPEDARYGGTIGPN